MNHHNYRQKKVTNVYDTSFQIHSGLYADQSQLNELDMNFDAFDETNPLGDPFATPRPNSKDKSPVIEDLTDRTIVPDSPEPTPPLKASVSYSHMESLDTLRINNPLLHVFKQPASNDFFDVRKRNGNTFGGLDLTSKSTARLWKDKDKKLTPEEFEAVVQSKLLATPPVVSSALEPSVSTSIMEIDPPVIEEAVLPLELEPKTEQRHPETVKDAGVTKNRPVKVKPILRNSKPSVSSIATRVMKPTTKTLKQEKKEAKENTENKDRRQSSGSLASLSGGLIDVLMSYGEKIRNSFGISSNSSKDPESPLPLGNKQCDAAEDTIQSNIPPEIPPELKQEDISTQEAHLNLSLPVSNVNPSQENEDISSNIVQIAPTRTSKKRLLPLSPGRESKKRCLQDENMNSTNGGKTLSTDGKTERPISRPRPLGASKAINKAIDDRGKVRLKASQTIGVVRSGKASAIGGFPRRNGGTRPASNSISGPTSGPLFASDVYRQLAAEKAQKEQQASTTAYFSKPVPPARPALRPTIPAAFVFRSEERIAQRHAETNEKPKAVEGHLAPSVVPAASVKITTTVQGRKISNTILPTDAPALNTLIRAKAREKFDAERKEREKILELQRLIRERERAEQEEREYREARKRTIPRAHEVPEWYKDASHKRKEHE